MKWPLVKINDFCITGSGSTPSRSNYSENFGGTIPWIKSGELKDEVLTNAEEYVTENGVKEARLKFVPREAVLVAMYGATVGRTALLDFEATTNQAVCHIIPEKNKATSKYLWYALRAKLPELLLRRVGGAQPNINQQIIQNTLISLPPISEQKRITAILDKADAVRRKRQETIRLLDEFLRSVFLEMFGDPVRNEKGWEELKLSKVGEINRGVSKHRPRNAPELLGGIYPLIQTGDVANSGLYIRKFNQTYSEVGLKQSKMWKKGTLCITIAANIAKTSILAFDACFPDSVVGFNANEKTNNIFIYYWFMFFQNIIEANAPESAQKNINLSILNDLSVIVPPIKLQNEFVRIVEKTEQQKLQLEKSLSEMENCFNSLMQKAFRVEL